MREDQTDFDFENKVIVNKEFTMPPRNILNTSAKQIIKKLTVRTTIKERFAGPLRHSLGVFFIRIGAKLIGLKDAEVSIKDQP